MSFIVFEGDNGTGKDTIATKVANIVHGEILTYYDDVKEQEKLAKGLVGKDRVLEFFKYNEYCGSLVRENNRDNLIVIRYWISTLAAAYADKIFSYDEVMNLTECMSKKLEKPDIVIRIRTMSSVRLGRIALRNAGNRDLTDDTTIDRAQRYEWISREILYQSGYLWREFDNTNVTASEISYSIVKCIREVTV